MREAYPFLQDDLDDLDAMLCGAADVVTMREVHLGQTDKRTIGMRHDVDNFIEPAVAFAEWEWAHGFRSTYFVLHSAPYWSDKNLLLDSLDEIAGFGHEIGIHNNAIAAALGTDSRPRDILSSAVRELRRYGFEIAGTVAHGDNRCYGHTGSVRFVNDEIFTECARPEVGDARRNVAGVAIEPFSMSELGLDYDANWLDRSAYMSDSGGRWCAPGFDKIADGFPFAGQLHMLVHPDWWAQAFDEIKVAA